MQYEDAAPITAANGGCFNCTSPNKVVVLDNVIEGIGVLCLCSACISDASNHIRMAKARSTQNKKEVL